MRKVLLTVGLGYGDESKGSVVSYLTSKEKADLVVRYCGGAQAAHHVRHPTSGDTHCFSQFGSGTFHGARTYLSQYMVINPSAMMREAERLYELGVRPYRGLMHINAWSLVTTPFHIASNRIREVLRGDAVHGSCGMGLGETMRVKEEMGRGLNLYAGDLFDIQRQRTVLKRQQQALFDDIVSSCYSAGVDVRDLPYDLTQEIDLLESEDSVTRIMRSWADFAERFGSDTIVKSAWFEDELQKSGTVVFEGAQGVLLDRDYGFFPHVTRSRTTLTNTAALLRGWSGESERIGILRCYSTRHGAGPFVSEDPELTHLAADDDNKTNDWQGRFRVGALDLVATRYAIEATGGVDSIFMTHLDKLSFPDGYTPVCIAYNSDNFHIDKLVCRPPSSSTLSGARFTSELLQSRPEYMRVRNSALALNVICNLLHKRPYGGREAVASFGPRDEDKREVGL